ncbi:uncharacterized protein LOC128922845 [Zeugodacus cucurbitae]|uniref:uncharacterized protein LOC128922845 n=1 Tax=Zeugodacus cucurbitae TaxID=28588 RepID=UPI0023D8EB1C|nr:uncharacterized protein LOC128922845 [Zeugodacus cucurbitae]
MMHVTCFAHALHRLAEFVRCQFNKVNTLIASNKSVFLKVRFYCIHKANIYLTNFLGTLAKTQTANTEVLDLLKKTSSDLSSVKSGECSMLPCSPQTKNFNLRELLKTSVNGQLALSYQEKHGYLDSRNQKNLTHCIVDYYIGLGRKMQYSDMREWADEIVAVFPKEKKEFYFLERKMGKRNPSGKLFSRWANAIKLENKANSVTQEAHEDVFDGVQYFLLLLYKIICCFNNI